MRTAEAMEVLAGLQPPKSAAVPEIGRREDVAFLKLSTDGHWAVVSSPGDRWFSLEVDGGYSLDYIEEDTPDDEARRILRSYVDLALIYLCDPPEPRPSGLLKLPVIHVPSEDGEVVLHRSLAKTLHHFWLRAKP